MTDSGYAGINPVADRDGERYPMKDLSDAMSTQIAIDDESYALAMIPMMPGPVRRYVERLQSEMAALKKSNLTLTEAARRYRSALLWSNEEDRIMSFEERTDADQELEEAEVALFYLLDELDNEDESSS